MIEASNREVINPANVFSAKYPAQINETWYVEVISVSGLVKAFGFNTQQQALTFYSLIAKYGGK